MQEQPPQGQNPDSAIKVRIVGNAGVGKSCMLLRYADNTFTETNISTIGVDFKLKTEEVDGTKVKMQVFDTDSKQRFRGIGNGEYIKGVQAVVLCYDVTDMASFSDIRNWIQEVNRSVAQDTTMILVGLKADMVDQRVVDTNYAAAFADGLNLKFFEASAKDGVAYDASGKPLQGGLNAVFQTVAKDVKDLENRTLSAAQYKGNARMFDTAQPAKGQSKPKAPKKEKEQPKTVEAKVEKTTDDKAAVRGNGLLDANQFDDIVSQARTTGQRVIYCEPWMTKEFLDKMIQNNGKEGNKKVFWAFGDNTKDFNRAHDPEEASKKRFGIGGQAAVLKGMTHEQYSDVAVGVVSTSKKKAGLGGFRREYEASKDNLAQMMADNPDSIILVPAKFKGQEVEQVEIGTGIAAGKLGMKRFSSSEPEAQGQNGAGQFQADVKKFFDTKLDEKIKNAEQNKQFSYEREAKVAIAQGEAGQPITNPQFQYTGNANPNPNDPRLDPLMRVPGQVNVPNLGVVPESEAKRSEERRKIGLELFKEAEKNQDVQAQPVLATEELLTARNPHLEESVDSKVPFGPANKPVTGAEVESNKRPPIQAAPEDLKASVAHDEMPALTRTGTPIETEFYGDPSKSYFVQSEAVPSVPPAPRDVVPTPSPQERHEDLLRSMGDKNAVERESIEKQMKEFDAMLSNSSFVDTGKTRDEAKIDAMMADLEKTVVGKNEGVEKYASLEVTKDKAIDQLIADLDPAQLRANERKAQGLPETAPAQESQYVQFSAAIREPKASESRRSTADTGSVVYKGSPLDIPGSRDSMEVVELDVDELKAQAKKESTPKLQNPFDALDAAIANVEAEQKTATVYTELSSLAPAVAALPEGATTQQQANPQIVQLPTFSPKTAEELKESVYTDVMPNLTKSDSPIEEKTFDPRASQYHDVMPNEANDNLFEAIKKGDLEAVKAAIEEGAEVNAKNPDGRTPLVEVGNSNIEIFKYLLEQGAKPIGGEIALKGEFAQANVDALKAPEAAKVEEKPKSILTKIFDFISVPFAKLGIKMAQNSANKADDKLRAEQEKPGILTAQDSTNLTIQKTEVEAKQEKVEQLKDKLAGKSSSYAAKLGKEREAAAQGQGASRQ